MKITSSLITFAENESTPFNGWRIKHFHSHRPVPNEFCTLSHLAAEIDKQTKTISSILEHGLIV